MINNPILGPDLQRLNGVTFIQKLVPALILFGLVIGVVFFFFNLLMGAIAYINSGGDKGKTEAARGRITNAIIGLIVLFCIFGIMNILEVFLGTDLSILDLDALRIR
jgi:hypothetical protein